MNINVEETINDLKEGVSNLDYSKFNLVDKLKLRKEELRFKELVASKLVIVADILTKYKSTNLETTRAIKSFFIKYNKFYNDIEDTFFYDSICVGEDFIKWKDELYVNIFLDLFCSVIEVIKETYSSEGIKEFIEIWDRESIKEDIIYSILHKEESDV